MLSRPDAQMPRSLKPRARVSVTEYSFFTIIQNRFYIYPKYISMLDGFGVKMASSIEALLADAKREAERRERTAGAVERGGPTAPFRAVVFLQFF